MVLILSFTIDGDAFDLRYTDISNTLPSSFAKVESDEEIAGLNVSTDYIMSVENRLNQGVKSASDAESYLDLKGLDKDAQKLLPDIMDESINDGVKIHDITTNSKWIGMTYKEDAEFLKEFIEKEIKKGVYPKKLWN